MYDPDVRRNLRARWGLKSYPRPLAVDAYDRKVQKKGSGGFIVAVPPRIANALGIDKGVTVRFWSVNGKAVFKPAAPDGLTPEDGADIDASKVSGENREPDPSPGQTCLHTCGRGQDGVEKRPGV